MSRFKNQSTPISELNLSNISDFITDYARYTFELAYKCLMKKDNAVALTINTLSRVVCVEAAEPGSDSVGSELGIQRAMQYFLTKAQRERMYDDSIHPDISSIYTPDVEDEIMDGAFAKASRDMPRYAPVFSGTSGSMIILTLVAFIVAAIVFIWINPLKGSFLETGDVSGTDIIYSAPAARLNNMLLLDIESAVSCTDAQGEPFTAGLPVKVNISGIDANDTLKINVTGDNGRPYPVYQLDSGCYCFVADRDQMYDVRVSSPGGASVDHYVSVYQLGEGMKGALSAPYCAIRNHGESRVSLFDGTQGIDPLGGPLSAGETLFGSVSVDRVPSGCKVMMDSSDKRTLIFTAEDGRTGIDSIALRVVDSNNVTTRHLLPVVIADNVPVIDPASRTVSVKHTPSKAGTLTSKLNATDADGDGMVYSLVDTVNCSVMLSPNGSYILRAAEGYGGSEASFSVTVSDGCIESSPVDIHVKLNNGLISKEKYRYDVVCMTADSGYYKLPLPSVDDDGDPITWIISSPENGQTDNAYISIDGNELVYRMFENVNKNYTDTIQLYCSDGWTTGTPIPFDIVCARNDSIE